jgi:hypothetical protein
MAQLGAALPQSDGLGCFNTMYMEVTRAVYDAVQKGGFNDPEFLERLDVQFANLYFDAVRQAAQLATRIPDAWAPLLSLRGQGGITPLRFALAGMNAHINHDLCIAVVRTCEERLLSPNKSSVQYQDFLRVNQILKATEDEVKGRLLTGLLSFIDRPLSSLDDAVALWSIEKARNLAWDNAEVLWHLRSSPELTADYLSLLERSVGTASRGLLIRT